MSLLDAFSALQCRWPAAAWLLAWPLLMAVLARRRQRRIEGYADAALRPWAVVADPATPGGRRGAWRTPAQWLAWALLAAALAGPRLPSEASDPAAGPARHAVDLMVVLDLSASMAEADVVPERLARARLELADLRRGLRGERLGLLVYAGEAGLLLPLTGDAALFDDALAQAVPDLLEARGSDPGAALALARAQLAASVPGSRAVLLVTDAEAGDLEGPRAPALREAVTALRADAVPVFVLAASASSDETAGDARQPAHAAWDGLVRPTGGTLVAVADGDGDRDALLRAIAAVPGAPVPPERVRGWRELFQWPLVVALALLAAVHLPPGALRRRRPATMDAVAVCALAMVLAAPTDAAAQDRAQDAAAVEARAWAAWRAGQWQQAQTLYARLDDPRAALWAGAAALKAGDATAAQRHFARALLQARDGATQADALYNLGHAHATQGRWATAAEAWQAVLQARPGDLRAARNLAVAQGEIARLRRAQPMASDLRGRRGSTAEGLVSTQGGGSASEPPTPEAPGARRGSGEGADDATLRADGDGHPPPAFVPDARHLASGLAKMERLGAARTTLLRGIVRQDRSAIPRPELPPW